MSYKDALEIEKKFFISEKRITEKEQKTILACLFVNLIAMPCKSLSQSSINWGSLENNLTFYSIESLSKLILNRM